MVFVLGVIFALVIGVVYLGYRLQHTSDQGDLAATIEREVQKATRHFECGGLVVGVYKEGKTLFKGLGSIHPDNPVAPTADSLFQIGSVSKLFTASTLQILCDEGVLSLDDTLDQHLGKHLPLAPSVKPITLRQLATHTAGFPSVPQALMQKLNSKVAQQQLMDNPYQELELVDIWTYLQNPVDLKKTGRFEYSNYGMGLLGHILEQASGQSLADLVSAKIFQPLQMKHSGIDLNHELPSQIMQGYTEKGCEKAQMWTFPVLAGAGAFYSNAQDLVRFIQANLASNTHLSLSLQKTHAPQMSGKTGLGWMQANALDRLVGNRHILWHNGRVGGFAAYLAFDQQQPLGVVILSSRSGDLNMLGMMLMRQLRTQSWKEPASV